MTTIAYKSKQPQHLFELSDAECGSGWHKLLLPIIKYVADYNTNKQPQQQIQFTQIKEKFGGLRVYTNFTTDELDYLIDNAEDKSYQVCEICGAEENVGMRVRSWLTTICLDCIKKETNKKNHPQYWKRNSDNTIFCIKSDGTMIKTQKKNGENTI